MGFDISNGPDFVGFDSRLTPLVDSGNVSSAASAAELAPLSADSIQASPLAFFGGVIEQIGQSMQGGANAQASGSAPGGMHDAIDMLESVMALMSAYGGDPSELPAIGQTGTTSALGGSATLPSGTLD